MCIDSGFYHHVFENDIIVYKVFRSVIVDKNERVPIPLLYNPNGEPIYNFYPYSPIDFSVYAKISSICGYYKSMRYVSGYHCFPNITDCLIYIDDYILPVMGYMGKTLYVVQFTIHKNTDVIVGRNNNLTTYVTHSLHNPIIIRSPHE